jgi:hypothetical protein
MDIIINKITDKLINKEDSKFKDKSSKFRLILQKELEGGNNERNNK